MGVVARRRSGAHQDGRADGRASVAPWAPKTRLARAERAAHLFRFKVKEDRGSPNVRPSVSGASAVGNSADKM